MECGSMLECQTYQAKFDHILYIVQPAYDEPKKVEKGTGK